MSKPRKLNTLTLSALFAAAMAMCAQIMLPSPWGVPFTLQTTVIALCGYVLQGLPAMSAVAVYVALGCVGLPVFSAFSGGIGVLLGPTGGFIWGFFILTFTCANAHRLKIKNHFATKIIVGIMGLVLCHLCGAIQFALVTQTSLLRALLISSVPFIVKDIILLALAALVAPRLKKVLDK